MANLETMISDFDGIFGGSPNFVVRAPGRVNLIGEHTDYNDGFVFPAAIQYDIAIAGRRRTDGVVRLRAADTVSPNASQFALNAIAKDQREPWSNYVRGVAVMLEKRGYPLAGFDGYILGTVPLGSGLSSSAALELAACLAFEASGGFDVPAVERALLSQEAENKFVGMNCGIMDQFISALGTRDHALLIDTRDLGYEAVPLPTEGVSIVIGNTRKVRELVGSPYNERRSRCAEAVEVLSRQLPGIRALRDVAPADLDRFGADLDPVTLMRARHVVTEDARTLAGVAALKAGDVAQFGKLMDASHESLRHDYEVSCTELDVFVEAARAIPGVLGSRLTGAGFGGCTVSLVRDEAVPAFQEQVPAIYTARTGLVPEIYVCTASQGAERLL